jgi:hypothetical protein
MEFPQWLNSKGIIKGEQGKFFGAFMVAFLSEGVFQKIKSNRFRLYQKRKFYIFINHRYS